VDDRARAHPQPPGGSAAAAALERPLDPLLFDFRLPPFLIIGQQKNRPLAVRILPSRALRTVGLFAGFADIDAVTLRARNGNRDHLDLFLALTIQPPNAIVKYESETLPATIRDATNWSALPTGSSVTPHILRTP